MPAVVGHGVHEEAFAVAEYWPAAQFVQVASTVAVQAAPRFVPAGHTVQGVHSDAPAADQLTPAAQFEQTASVVAVQVEERYLPAAHTLEAQAAHGAKPVAE